MKIVTRYIARRIFKGILLAFLIVTGIILLVDFVEATRNIGDDGNLSLLQIGGLTLLKIPQLIEETIPFVVLFGVMGALYGLNKRSELVVLRASGLSAWRFLRPAVCVSAAIGIIWAVVFNPLAARSMAKYQSILSTAAQASEGAGTAANRPFRLEDVWLREGSELGQIVIHGTLKSKASRQLHDVTFYYYDVSSNGEAATGEPQFSRRLDAGSAVLMPGGYWQLSGIVRNSGDGSIERSLTASLPTKLTLTDLRDHKRTKSKAPFWNLQQKIADAETAGFSTVGLRMQWHKLLSLPLTLIALTVVAAGVSMGNTRSGGVLRLMMAGGVVGFGVYFFNNLISAFGQAQTLPIIVAAWTVPVLVLLLGLAFLARLEDG